MLWELEIVKWLLLVSSPESGAVPKGPSGSEEGRSSGPGIVQFDSSSSIIDDDKRTDAQAY